jgi:hypothetical protein
MNYLTNYYKNLSEQLQVRVNSLEKLLNEEEDMKDGLLTDVHPSEITPQTIHKIHPDHLEYHLNMLNNMLDDSDGTPNKNDQVKADLIGAHLEKIKHFS